MWSLFILEQLVHVGLICWTFGVALDGETSYRELIFYKRQQKTEGDFVFTYWPVMNEELIFDGQRTAIGASCSTTCRPLWTMKHKGVTLAFYLLCGKDSWLHEGDQLPICRNTLMYCALVRPSLLSYLSWNQSFGQVLCVVHKTVLDRRCVG